jgi:hypothetical protein
MMDEPNLTTFEYCEDKEIVKLKKGQSGFGFVVLSKIIQGNKGHFIGRIIRSSEASR